MGCYYTTKYQDCFKGRQQRRQNLIVKTNCPFSFHALRNEDGSYDLQHRSGVLY